MTTLIATITFGMFATIPMDTLPPKRKTIARPPVYAIIEDKRIAMLRKVTQQDKRRPFGSRTIPYNQDVSYEQFYVN